MVVRCWFANMTYPRVTVFRVLLYFIKASNYSASVSNSSISTRQRKKPGRLQTLCSKYEVCMLIRLMHVKLCKLIN